jgi:hypothetical protein
MVRLKGPTERVLPRTEVQEMAVFRGVQLRVRDVPAEERQEVNCGAADSNRETTAGQEPAPEQGEPSGFGISMMPKARQIDKRGGVFIREQ